MAYKLTKQIEKALRDAIKYFGSAKGLAQALGVSKAMVSHWTRGRWPVALHQAFKIQDLTHGKVMAFRLRGDIYYPFNKKYDKENKHGVSSL